MTEKIPFRFQVSGNIIKKFGRESISNKNVAVLELIKNSFDSKASRVSIDFENLESNPKLVIADNGEGMNYDDIQNKWMMIATPNKSERLLEGNRTLIGEKGIGRLSSERLGKKTILVTLPKSENFGYNITFDWEEYGKENKLVGDIINEGYKFEKKKKGHGTTLEIYPLRDNWNISDELKHLLKDIFLIHPPNKSIPNFKISVPFKSRVKDLEKPRKSILEKVPYRLKVKLSAGNRVNYEFYVMNKKKRSDWIKFDRKLICGDLSFELFFYYRRKSDYESRFGKQMPKADMDKINSFLDEYAGIKLYRDNFRVKPFGENGNDWIGLDPLSQNNPSIIPRNYQVFGMVHIGRLKNPKIKDVTTREGIDYNDEARDMIHFIKWCIDPLWVELRSEAEPTKKKSRKGVKVTKTGRRKTGIKIEAPKIPETKEKPLLEIRGKYPQIFYDRLEDEINLCYNNNLPNAAFFLCRKLVENLILDILMKKFPNNHSLWWSAQGYHLNLSPLIKNLHVNRREFRPNAKSYIEKFNSLVDKFRNETNNNAHNLHDYLDDKSDLEPYKIKDMVQLLINIYNNC